MSKFGAYDSEHELWFEWYLEELYDAGIVKSFKFQPKHIDLFSGLELSHQKQLKTKIKMIPYTLLGEHKYTPDFFIVWNPEYSGIFYSVINDISVAKDKPFYANLRERPDQEPTIFSLVDVKGAYVNPRQGDGRSFGINQKWIYQQRGIYVEKVIVSNKAGIFKTSFTPDKFRQTETGKERVIHYEPIRSLGAFVKDIKTRIEMGV
jgi:hypothetical protein